MCKKAKRWWGINKGNIRKNRAALCLSVVAIIF